MSLILISLWLFYHAFGDTESVCPITFCSITFCSACAINADCQSNCCGQSLDGINRCPGPCYVASQSGCAAGTVCYPNVISERFAIDPPGPEGDIFDSFDSCSSNVGTYDACSKDADCSAGESCSVAFNDNRSVVNGRCTTNIGAQPGGAACAIDADCQSGECLTCLTNACFGACNNTPDCMAPATCTLTITLDNMGTMDTSDDLVVNTCVP